MSLSTLKAWRRRARLARNGIAPEIERASARYGARSGVWVIATAGLDVDSVVYSFGVGDNLAWELAMVEQRGLRVHAFDPTPRSRDWIAGQQLPGGLLFEPIGLAGHDGELELYLPRKAGSKNYSVLPPRRGRGETVACPVARLSTLAEARGHRHIDVLKMDVEGAEMRALPDVLGCGPPIGQLLIELHYGHPAVSFEQALALLQEAREHGFRILDISPRGYEFTLVHEDWPFHHAAGSSAGADETDRSAEKGRKGAPPDS